MGIQESVLLKPVLKIRTYAGLLIAQNVPVNTWYRTLTYKLFTATQFTYKPYKTYTGYIQISLWFTDSHCQAYSNALVC